MDSSFAEPRAWALSWEGSALFPAPDCAPRQDDARDPAPPPAEWAPRWQQVSAATMPVSRNGHGWNGLTPPRSWALRWDGAALDGGANGHDPAHVRPAEREKEGAA